MKPKHFFLVILLSLQMVFSSAALARSPVDTFISTVEYFQTESFESCLETIASEEKKEEEEEEEPDCE